MKRIYSMGIYINNHYRFSCLYFNLRSLWSSIHSPFFKSPFIIPIRVSIPVVRYNNTHVIFSYVPYDFGHVCTGLSSVNLIIPWVTCPIIVTTPLHWYYFSPPHLSLKKLPYPPPPSPYRTAIYKNINSGKS